MSFQVWNVSNFKNHLIRHVGGIWNDFKEWRVFLNDGEYLNTP